VGVITGLLTRTSQSKLGKANIEDMMREVTPPHPRALNEHIQIITEPMPHSLIGTLWAQTRKSSLATPRDVQTKPNKDVILVCGVPGVPGVPHNTETQSFPREGDRQQHEGQCSYTRQVATKAKKP
jgi:hypothetical protein